MSFAPLVDDDNVSDPEFASSIFSERNLFQQCDTSGDDAGYKIVVNFDGTFNLVASIAHSVHVASGSPCHEVCITESMKDASYRYAVVQCCRHVVLDLARYSTVSEHLSYLPEKTVSMAEWSGCANLASCSSVAASLIHSVADSESVLLLRNVTLVVLSFCAEGIQRSTGQNWLAGIAGCPLLFNFFLTGGRPVVDLCDFQRHVGTHLWSFMESDCCRHLKAGFEGKVEAIVDPDYEVGYRAVGTGCTLNSVLDLTKNSEACAVENGIGLSSVLLGMELLAILGEAVAGRSNSDRFGVVRPMLEYCASRLRELTGNRAAITSVRAAVCPAIATSVGLSPYTFAAVACVSRHTIIQSLANKNPRDLLHGVQIRSRLTDFSNGNDSAIEAAREYLGLLLDSIINLSDVLELRGMSA